MEELMKKVTFIFSLAGVLLYCASQAAYSSDPEKVGASTCMGCHSDQVEAFKKNTHAKTLPAVKKISFEESCETCHGPGSLHAEAAGDKTNPGFASIKNPKKLSVSESSETCLKCHENGNRAFWKGSQHESRDVSCLNCHSMHHSKTDPLMVKNNEAETCYQCHQIRKAQSLRSSHMPLRDGKMQCSSCHNPHGSAGPKLLAQNSTNENCYACHAEKRGPFLWEHAPVRENCLNCHEAHGSQHDKLLKVKRPRLCQQCHIESRHPTTAGADPDAFEAGLTNIGGSRACTQCHAQIHGSNHPAGARLQR
ncbi:MAG: hypothetical protein A3I11_07200 [Elusimicrobia bacterium RIFCSPLOWO2_02_FULL_39_32]|nr:MAG: hypothetical protein A2034_07730 [Elusimicrobia bacterium GWA2_38_7]OGR81458.1 MAG: hypothetical protein A3B80_05425 [Elusimicrobia bacterium RIFCSPHIGHO2_02_FULL_39_36]OGR91973.1 MAG: hypothetical protein A3I11_07200 [Elusimicrobia bacterium RIFCSPLOWO2_02_FULL_39_32]OGR98735.1 MAG: hypothetical protein A3G85_05230 [Elusimicrobia bacterium RIFCSPLOWO2_12_FULL_39_28]